MKNRLLVAAVGLVAALSLSACGGASSGSSTAANTKVVIGVDDGAEEHWTLLKNKLKDQGIDLEVKNFTDGAQINTATQQGQVDINLFQHLKYLSQFNVNSNGTLVPVGATAVYPLALYSEKFKSVEELPADAEVAIPNNPTNQARALLNLQTAGLLQLKDGGNSLSTPAEITSSKIKVVPVDSNQTVNALKGTTDAAVVNNTQAQKGGLGDEKIIFKEDLNSESLAPYINGFVVKADRKDDPTWKKIVDAYHTPEVEASVTKLNDGNLQFKADWTAAKLQEVLTAEEEAIKKTK
ncbi:MULTISPECIES: MetQ/NlpA family ABC transporter substrate-binding protein [Paenarthrobacter]|jgi:D-methionine transport system substrate-binding protein|uniref:D-methionine transport system substrate-binding protein n=1 Tax=Paenarthrobacter nicotinovorans TaxID=29320 RepID=A0ABT9TNG1_PAENI|nr:MULTISPECIES: MetQ/NlpA family ABC transporter substrate-binding protein [Paenarthrobacter]KQR06746.1 ABC transporter [Arthrobacter sp. Leaf145]SKB83832.1 D-methionine transport system substrate-binding protein [Arthrobacter sp. 31Cvi3.1E]BCW12094.1 putative ABC-type transporter, periplasmic component [Arthrobacter sp. NtRootA2]BCW16178.1 putative ABC-type transporter, periplasmic component [Arthrobacter sp. NtRootA4]BCW24510.1 putative ABC-type transporter, periplasmic component [Arthrobac